MGDRYVTEIVVTLLVGGYLYTTGVFLFLMRRFERLELNHLRHVERALNETRETVGLPPVDLDG